MEFEEEEPVSPTGQYMSSSALSLTTLGFLEFQVPVDDMLPATFALITDQFLPINPRFSSKMIEDDTGFKKWKRVEVDLQEHVKIPTFPQAEVYDEYFDEYVSNISMQPLPRTRPLWEIHIIQYKTSNAAATAIFKLHQALGDGYSLIGALLSTLKRADNPSLPLTFPSRQSTLMSQNNPNNILKRATKVFSSIVDTVLDFGSFLLRGEDDQTPIRSGDEGVEFRQLEYTTLTFSLDQIKQVKDILKVTVNDLVMGTILYGIRVYMRGEKHESMKAAATAMLLFNTRNAEGGYNSVSEMVMRDSAMPWGNQITATHVDIPELTAKSNSYSELEDFVLKIHETTQRKKNSSAIYLTGLFIDGIRKFKGPEAAARFIHSDIRKSSLVLSNLIGPMEQMALADHPVKGLYFTFSGAPLSLGINVLSYMGNLRVAIASEKVFIDQLKLKACIQEAFDTIFASLPH